MKILRLKSAIELTFAASIAMNMPVFTSEQLVFSFTPSPFQEATSSSWQTL